MDGIEKGLPRGSSAFLAGRRGFEPLFTESERSGIIK
jgi:hypothetical protein